jgi:hypothetical protein
VGVSIVMLIASGLAFACRHYFRRSLRTSAPRPALAVGVRSRQAVGSGPRTFSFHLAVPRPPCFSHSGLSVPPCRSMAFLCVLPGRYKTTFRLRASRCICGSLGSLRGVLLACFPTLLRASSPYRSASVFPFRSNGFPSKPQVRFHRFDTGKLRPKSESRKRNLHDLSTRGRIRCGQPIGGP